MSQEKHEDCKINGNLSNTAILDKNKNGNHSNDDQNKLEKLILKLNKFLEKTENKFKKQGNKERIRKDW